MDDNFSIIKDKFLEEYGKEIEKQNHLVLLTKNEENLIVEERLFYLMLLHKMMPEQLLALDYAQRSGWHFGDDGKIYERFKLSDRGEMAYFCVFNKEIEKYKNENLKKDEKVKIFYRVNNIVLVKPYKELELCKEEREQETLTA